MLLATPIRLFATALLLSPGLVCTAQIIQVPRPQPGGQVDPKQAPAFDDAHLADRPYGMGNPKPNFPSSERVQREFVVEYLYEYAFSQYTPQVTLPVIPRVQARHDTPENSLIALFSAMRNGDFEAWLQCWDEADRKRIFDDTKTTERTPTFWIEGWKKFFGQAKTTVLIDRVEAEYYIILDALMPGPNPSHIPTVFKQVDNEWFATNELSNNPMLFAFSPKFAGVIYPIPPIPVARMDADDQKILAQREFIKDHATRTREVQAGPIPTPAVTTPVQ